MWFLYHLQLAELKRTLWCSWWHCHTDVACTLHTMFYCEYDNCMLWNNGWALVVAVFLLQQRALSLLSAYILQIAHLWKIFWREWKCKKKLCNAKQLHTSCSAPLSVVVLRTCCCTAVRSCGWVNFQIAERTTVENILKVAKLDFCFRHSFSVAYCVKSHMATLRTW